MGVEVNRSAPLEVVTENGFCKVKPRLRELDHAPVCSHQQSRRQNPTTIFFRFGRLHRFQGH